VLGRYHRHLAVQVITQDAAVGQLPVRDGLGKFLGGAHLLLGDLTAVLRDGYEQRREGLVVDEAGGEFTGTRGLRALRQEGGLVVLLDLGQVALGDAAEGTDSQPGTDDDDDGERAQHGRAGTSATMAGTAGTI